MFTARKFLRPMNTRNRRKLKRGGQYYPGFGGHVTAGEVYFVIPPTAGFPPYLKGQVDRYVRETYNGFGNLYQVGGIKGDPWISKVKIFEKWYDKNGNLVVRVLRVK